MDFYFGPLHLHSIVVFFAWALGGFLDCKTHGLDYLELFGVGVG
jgi:hypothetical protein